MGMVYLWRLQEQDHVYTSNEYPHKTKYLILTGCHSIVVEEITDQAKDSILSVLNDL